MAKTYGFTVVLVLNAGISAIPRFGRVVHLRKLQNLSSSLCEYFAAKRSFDRQAVFVFVGFS